MKRLLIITSIIELPTGLGLIAVPFVVAHLLLNSEISGAALILALAGIRSGFVGIALWPAVILHAVMAVWCIACLPRSSINVID